MTAVVVIALLTGGVWLGLVAAANLNAAPTAPRQEPNDYGEQHRTT